jgi:hypothetical protein
MTPRVAGLAAATLAAALLALVGLRAGAPEGLRPKRLDSYLADVGSRNAFRRTESAEAFALEFGFVDHQGESHDVACRVLRRDHEQLLARFGYGARELEAAAIARQQEFADAELRRRGLAPYFRVDIAGTTVRSRPADTPATWSSLTETRVAELELAVRALLADVVQHRRQVEGDLYRERGFRLEGRDLFVDYPALVRWSAPALDACAKALRWAGAGYDERAYLGLFTAFIQELRYELPPGVQGGRQTLGFSVPTEVLTSGRGDCDSKAVTFSALWRAFASPVIFVILPRHVLVGVAMPPGPGQQFVRIGNRYYVLCEIAGPAKIAPGAHRVEGSFRYMAVE